MINSQRFVDKQTKCLSMKQAAHHLKIGSKTLFRILRERGCFIKTTKYNLPRPELIEKGYFKNEIKTFKRANISGQYIKIYVTPLGMSFLAEIIQKEQNK